MFKGGPKTGLAPRPLMIYCALVAVIVVVVIVAVVAAAATSQIIKMVAS
jgi:hypothetical protein